MRSREVAVRGARVRSPLGLSPPGTRGVARATGSALPPSRIARPLFLGAKRKSETRVCASRRLRWRKRFPRRLERNDRSPQRTFTTRRVTPRARAAPPAHPRTSNPPFRLHHDVVPRRTRRRPPRGPVALHEHGPLDQVLRGVALQRLAGYVSPPRPSRASQRTELLTLAAPARRQEPGARGCTPSPRTITTSTPKKKSTCERLGDEVLETSSWRRTRHARLFSTPNGKRVVFLFRGVLPKTPNEARRRPPLPVLRENRILS